MKVSFEVSAFILDGFPYVAIKFFDEPVPDTNHFIFDTFETNRQFKSLHGLVLIEDNLIVFLPQKFLDKLLSLKRHLI